MGKVKCYNIKANKDMLYLDILGEGPEDLFGDSESPEKTVSAEKVDGLLARVVPVKVRDGLLESQQVVHCAGDDVDCSCVTCLGPQVVLEVCDQCESTL